MVLTLSRQNFYELAPTSHPSTRHILRIVPLFKFNDRVCQNYCRSSDKLYLYLIPWCIETVLIRHFDDKLAN